MKMTMLLALTLSIFMFAGCQAASVRTNEEVGQISVDEAKAAVTAPDAQFIDVRSREEYAGGHAAKAALFPLDALEKDLAGLDREKPVYVICQTGRRSQKGAEILQKAGFKRVYNIRGGTAEWIEKGFPVEK